MRRFDVTSVRSGGVCSRADSGNAGADAHGVRPGLSDLTLRSGVKWCGRWRLPAAGRLDCDGRCAARLFPRAFQRSNGELLPGTTGHRGSVEDQPRRSHGDLPAHAADQPDRDSSVCVRQQAPAGSIRDPAHVRNWRYQFRRAVLAAAARRVKRQARTTRSSD